MYWPISTPREFTLPHLQSFNQAEQKLDCDANSAGRDSIISVKSSKNGTFFGIVTKSTLYVYQNRPFGPIAVCSRPEQSIRVYGTNVNILIRPDNQTFIVQTTLGFFLTYILHNSTTTRVAKYSFDNSAGIPYVLAGPGEEQGVKEGSIKFRMVIKIDAGIETAVALEDELLVLTSNPPAIQLIKWISDSRGGPQTRTVLLSHLEWFNLRGRIVSAEWERAMGLFGWISSNGMAWAVVRQTLSSPAPDKASKSHIFSGYCFYNPNKTGSSTESEADRSETSCLSKNDTFAVNIAINSRFSLIGVGTESGMVHIYSVQDYAGHIPLMRTIIAPNSIYGGVTVVTWSPDGYSLFVGYSHGWALFSVYGKLVSHSMLAEGDLVPNDHWLAGVQEAVWLSNGAELLLVPVDSSEMWLLELSKWGLAGSYTWDNLSRTILSTSEKLLLYRGQDQSDLTTISHEAILWQEIAIPYAYLTSNWPIQQVCISGDGRFIAVAGKRGLGHYSVYTGKWKFFSNEQMENEFSVHGGMVWFNSVLIVGVHTDRNTHEIRAYSRDRELNHSLVIHAQQLPSLIILLSLVGDSLLVYTYNNTLYEFVIYSNAFQFSLELVGQISFNGIVHAPARVRAINWILPDEQSKIGNPINDISLATIVFLIDGKLVILYPLSKEGDLKYDMKVLMQNVEYFTIVTKGVLKNSIWAFDGKCVIVWLEVMLHLSKSDFVPSPIRIETDFYPLSFLFEKGIIIGIESNFVHRRNVSFTYSVNSTRTQLFIHQLLKYYLVSSREAEAFQLAKSFKHLTYFGHALEMMLHDALDEEADNMLHSQQSALSNVVKFLKMFPEMLDVIVGCTRKTEMASWHVLFEIVGSPKELFEMCMRLGQLKTAGAYLLILHTMEQLEDSSADMIRLFSAAVKSGDWELCKELARFLAALDNTGKTLGEAIKCMQLGSESNLSNARFLLSEDGAPQDI
ncbi:RIC1-domain-containing protein [Lipomyces arxii]|uniref:RIC1-domain-containing protein n=1 Tax=Lipomyces arxii TaxID=56418 RepID=UPI0034D004E5